MAVDKHSLLCSYRAVYYLHHTLQTLWATKGKKEVKNKQRKQKKSLPHLMFFFSLFEVNFKLCLAYPFPSHRTLSEIEIIGKNRAG
jgi:hypothetical protein